ATSSERRRRPRTSSTTAAPMTMRASRVSERWRSRRTRTVMPTLGGERSADEETGDGRGLRQEEVGGERAEQRRGDHAGAGDEGRGEAGAGQLARVGIEAGFEEQDGGADLRQQLQRRPRLERQRAEEQAGAQLAQHRRLPEAR